MDNAAKKVVLEKFCELPDVIKSAISYGKALAEFENEIERSQNNGEK